VGTIYPKGYPCRRFQIDYIETPTWKSKTSLSASWFYPQFSYSFDRFYDQFTQSQVTVRNSRAQA